MVQQPLMSRAFLKFYLGLRPCSSMQAQPHKLLHCIGLSNKGTIGEGISEYYFEEMVYTKP
jgi:hypothetical protein